MLFARIFVVINFANDTRLVLIGRGQRGPEGNTAVGRVEDTSLQSDCTQHNIPDKNGDTTHDIGQKGTE